MKRTVSVLMTPSFLAAGGHVLSASAVTGPRTNTCYDESQALDGYFSLGYRADIDTLAVQNPDTTPPACAAKSTSGIPAR